MKAQVEGATVVLVTPLWETQPWFPVVMSMLVDLPILLPNIISRSLPAKRSFLTLHYLILTLSCVNNISVYSCVHSVNVIDLASTSGYQSNAQPSLLGEQVREVCRSSSLVFTTSTTSGTDIARKESYENS